MRADLFLVEHGFATTRSQAQRLIGSGVQWRVVVDEAEVAAPWKRVAKNGDEIPDAAEVEVLDNTEAKYISRGGLKLEGALKATGLDVTGLRCLDVGQSTGGFTDCLLQHGAVQVVGVDVGHGQLHVTMRDDDRVVCLEGINARSLTAADLVSAYAQSYSSDDGRDADRDAESEPGIDPVFDFLTGDLSFISLTLVLPAVVRLLKADGLCAIQAITIQDQIYDRAAKSVDFIQRYVFPGSTIPSLTRILGAATKSSDLKLTHLEDLTPHYATTLKLWRERFHENIDAVRALGQSEAFTRLWTYYLCYCEGGFAERAIGSVQLLFAKPKNRRDPILPRLS